MVGTALFWDQWKELDEEEQQRILKSLRRARDGLPTPGVDNPFGGEWLLWPCGDRKVLLRPMGRDEVEAETGAPGKGFLLYSVEPSPF
jgi:hypothetical protein